MGQLKRVCVSLAFRDRMWTLSAAVTACCCHNGAMVDLSQLDSLALGPSTAGVPRAVVAPLVDHLSEAALNRARVRVEVEWLLHLTARRAVPGAPALTDDDAAHLRGVVERFGEAEIAELAAIEAETRHDVKAVEYSRSAGWTRRRRARCSRRCTRWYIFCTSEDINNLAYALTVRSAVSEVCCRQPRAWWTPLAGLARATADVPMLAGERTASPPPPPRSGRSSRCSPTGWWRQNPCARGARGVPGEGERRDGARMPRTPSPSRGRTGRAWRGRSWRASASRGTR